MATYYNDPWLGWNNVSYGTTASTNLAWNQWVANGTTASTTVNVWNAWNNYPPTGSTITTAAVWYAWQARVGVPNASVNYYTAPRQYTPEEIQANEELERRYHAERAQREAEWQAKEARRTEAKARAKALLLDHLDPVQKREYEEKGTFRVEVGSRSFRINPGTHGNVKEIHIEGGREIVIRSFCIPSRRGDIPEPDVHLAQKLMLEGGESSILDFHRIANITEYRPELRPRLDRELVAA